MGAQNGKDRLGQKLRDLEKAREDQWAAQQDRELLEKLRRKAQMPKLQMNCPRCGRKLEPVTRGALSISLCAEHGAWVEKEVLELLLARS
jgi:uncharacterized protein with PIN domain